MANSDYSIANQSFPSFRTDLNNALAAIASTNSGTSAPSTTFANQLWYDSSANILYIRNEDNDANIPLLQLDQSSDLAITLATVIDILDASGTNTAGTDLTIRAGAGTGTGAGGNIILQTANAGSSGSSVNSHATAVTIDDAGNVGIGASPDSPLHISASTEPYIRVENTDTGLSSGQVTGGVIFEQNDSTGGGTGITGRIQMRSSTRPDTGQYFGTGADMDFLVSGNSSGYATDNATKTAMTIRAGTGNVGIGTTSPDHPLRVSSSGFGTIAKFASDDGSNNPRLLIYGSSDGMHIQRTSGSGASNLIFNIGGSEGGGTERMRITATGDITTTGTSTFSRANAGFTARAGDSVAITRDAGTVLEINRSNDGTLVDFRSATVAEGNISVSGTTVSYNGGHLSRWSQLTDGTKDTSILKGTVMTNLDQMAVWSHDAVDAVEAQDAVFDDNGNLVSEAVEAVEAQDAFTEDNEQLNCMAVSSVEGDTNVAGVFVNWDNDDDDFNDMNIAMTGDMVIRIAQGTTVARGDLLMSAGDGTAKPQDDDIVRSKTIAKVTSTNVSHTYDDGSYLVPCVLMAC